MSIIFSSAWSFWLSRMGAPVLCFSFIAPPTWSMCACVTTICFTCQAVLLDDSQDVLDLVAGIDHHRFARALVADDGAIALQRSDGNHLVDHKQLLALSHS